MNVKATITNCVTNEVVECVFNPKEYTFSKQNKWEEKKADKKSVASLKFSGGAPANLKLQLLFDTYESHDRIQTGRVEAGKDVREYTKGLWEMMKIDEKKKEPPHCQFKWGNLWSFEAVIESISQKFTLFDKNGTPLRAILDVSFKQIKDEGQYPRQNPTSGGSPDERLRTVHEGETLLGIAGEEYGDPNQWRYLAGLNQIADPLRLRAGQMLIVKPLPLL
jgi:nucleoid-associated protein YgaU